MGGKRSVDVVADADNIGEGGTESFEGEKRDARIAGWEVWKVGG